MSENLPPFLEVSTLLETSRPRRSGMRFWHLVAVFMLVVMTSAYFSSHGEAAAQAVNLISSLAMVALVGAMIVIMVLTVRRVRAEEARLQGIEELVRLRRWPEAAAMLQEMLGSPVRMPHLRIQALIFLASVYARYGRFEDAVTVYDYILGQVQPDPATAHGLRLGRAMALLQQDHLVDADRAISELRNQVSRAGRMISQQSDESEKPDSPQELSAGLALLGIYRDVKTGHPQEAIETFESTLTALRDQLGLRVADAYMLAARAMDQVGRAAEAQVNFAKATRLVPAEELYRRYPETASLANRYMPTPVPAEVA